MTLNLISLIIVILFTAGVIKYLLHVKLFFNQIETHHPKQWLIMGMPRLNFQFGDPRYRNAMRYIRKHEFKDLDDDVLEEQYQKLLFLEKLGVGIFILLLGLALYPALF
jgi:hypothetical protein